MMLSARPSLGDIVNMPAVIETQTARMQAMVRAKAAQEAVYGGFSGLGEARCVGIMDPETGDCIGDWITDDVAPPTPPPDITTTVTGTCNPNVNYGPADPCYAWQVARETQQLFTTGTTPRPTSGISSKTLLILAAVGLVAIVAFKD